MFDNMRLVVLSDYIIHFNTPHNLYRNENVDLSNYIRHIELPLTRENLNRSDNLAKTLSKNGIYEVTLKESTLNIDYPVDSNDVLYIYDDDIEDNLLGQKCHFEDIIDSIIRILINNGMYSRDFIYKHISPLSNRYDVIKVKLKKEFVDDTGEYPKYTTEGENFIREITYNYSMVYEDIYPIIEGDDFIYEINLSRALGDYHNRIFIKKIFSYLDLASLVKEGRIRGIFSNRNDYFSENTLSVFLELNEKYYHDNPERMYSCGNNSFIIVKELNEEVSVFFDKIKDITKYTKLDLHIIQEGVNLYISLGSNDLKMAQYLSTALEIRIIHKTQSRFAK